MKSTLTRQVANQVCKLNGHQTWNTVIFNDKLKDGRRSLKVWGWEDSDYLLATKLLRKAGAKVSMEIFETSSVLSLSGTQTRLHVTE